MARTRVLLISADTVGQSMAGPGIRYWELARQLASQVGLERIRIRGTDATGARVRIEIRDGRIVKNEGGGAARADNRGNARNDHARNDRREDRVARMDHDDRRGRRGGIDRERPERAARAERVERVERPGRVERVERVERPERSGGNSGRG